MNADLLRNLEMVRNRIERACRRSLRNTDTVRLIAVTKTCDLQTVQALIDLGVRDIGENRVQEITAKAPALHGNYQLHMIGRLQTNKVGPLVEHVRWIQSIDRERLITRIDTVHNGEKIKALVEVNTSGESSKSGCAPEECRMLAEMTAKSKSMEFCGLMTIGPLNGGEPATRRAFVKLRELSEQCRDLAPVPELSMGMSGDFEWAIEEGATMVRVGTLLVGARQ